MTKLALLTLLSAAAMLFLLACGAYYEQPCPRYHHCEDCHE